MLQIDDNFHKSMIIICIPITHDCHNTYITYLYRQQFDDDDDDDDDEAGL